MKRSILLNALLIFLALPAFAQTGGEIYYRSLDSSHYEITAYIYRDCRGTPFSGVDFKVDATGVSTQTITPTKTAIEEIKYHCDSDPDLCSPSNTYGTGFGLERHVFKDTIDFSSAPFNTTAWGNACEITVSVSMCCRPNASNVTSNTNFYIEAMFNKCKAQLNSSPIFTNQPLFRLFVSQPNIYSYGMLDTADRDSMSIKLIAAKTSASNNVTYATSANCSKPYSAIMPLTAYQSNPCGTYKQTAVEGFYLDAKTGELYFTPVENKEDGAIVAEVTEWRKNSSGVYEVVGRVMRENLVIIESSTTNNYPKLSGTFVYTVNAGDSLSFNITTSDVTVVPPPPAPSPSPDTTRIFWDGAIDGATFNVNNPNSRLRTGTFGWRPTCDDIMDQPHRFTVTVRDNNCSPETRSSRTVFVYVRKVDKIDLGPDITICQGDTVTVGPVNGFTGGFKWNDNVYSKSRQVTTAGTYILEGVSNCNDTAFDTIVVTVAPKPMVNLGADTNLCFDTDFKLWVNAPNAASIDWSNGLTTDTITTEDTTDTYWVTINDKYCGTLTDTITVTRHQYPDVNLGADTIVCDSDTVTLTVNAPNADSIWWNGVNTNQPTYKTYFGNTGNIDVEVKDKYCGVFRDTINVDHSTTPIVNIGNDTTYCGPYTRILDAGNAGSTYTWSTGDTSQSITADSFGVYWVDVTSTCGTVRDSIVINDTTTLNFSLGPDRLICDEDSIQIGTGILNANYQWSTNANDTNNMVTIDSSGTYWVEITLCSQTKRDSIDITFGNSPVVNLGADTNFNGTVSDTLNAGNAGSTYSWSTGDTTQTLIVDSAGVYIVTVTNQCGTDSDTISITVTSIKGPNAIAKEIKVYPNPASNSVTISFTNANVGEVKLELVDMTGKTVYSKDVNLTSNSQHEIDITNLPSGIYFLQIQSSKGTVTTKLVVK